MSLSLQEYHDYLAGFASKKPTLQQVMKTNNRPVKKIKPKTFTTKKR